MSSSASPKFIVPQQRPQRRALLLCAPLLLCACDPPPRALLVNVRSDLIAGREAVRAETELFRSLDDVRGTPVDTTTRDIAEDVDLAETVRVSEFTDLDAGTWALRVRLVDDEGSISAERIALVDLKTAATVTIVLTRDCRGVVCPAAGGDPAAIACLGGRCVRPECLPEVPESCPPDICGADAECPSPPASCLESGCFEGVCFSLANDQSCGEGGTCDPELGCQFVSPPPFDPATGTTAEVLTFGDGGDADGYDLAAGPDGELYVVGVFDGTLNLGGETHASTTAQDLFIASFEADGTFRWSRSVGGATGASRSTGVTTDGAGNVYLAADIQGTCDFGGESVTSRGMRDAAVASYDTRGDLRWTWSGGGIGPDLAYDVAVSPNGELWVVGYYEGEIVIGPDTLPAVAQGEAFVARLALETGEALGAVGLASPGSDAARAVTVDANGDGYLALGFGGALTIGDTEVTGSSIVSLDGSLSVRWARSLGTGTVWGLEITPTGGLVATGSISDGDLGGGALSLPDSDAFVAHYDAAGEYQWSRVFGGVEGDMGLGTSVDSLGNIYAVGLGGVEVDFGGGPVTSGGGQDAFVVSFAPDGAYRWGTLAGGPEQDRGHGVIAAGSVVYATGRFTATADLGLGEVISAGGDDLFLIRYE